MKPKVKTEKDIALAIAGIAMMIKSKKISPEPYVVRQAEKTMDILLWTVGYPSNFDEIFKQIQKLPVDPDVVIKAMEESLEEVRQKNKSKEGGDSFSA